jgi:hypothetical protein
MQYAGNAVIFFVAQQEKMSRSADVPLRFLSEPEIVVPELPSDLEEFEPELESPLLEDALELEPASPPFELDVDPASPPFEPEIEPALPIFVPEVEPALPVSLEPIVEIETVVTQIEEPDEWQEYLCRLRNLPSVRLQSDEGYAEHWDNLYDYYAAQLCVASTVAQLAQLEPCAARAVLGDMAALLDEAIAEQSSWWNWFADEEELVLMRMLRKAL